MAIGFGGLIALEYSKTSIDTVKKMALMTMPCFPETMLDNVRAHRRKTSKNYTYIPADTILKKTTLLAEEDAEYNRLRQIMKKQSVSTYVKLMDLTISADTLTYLNNNRIPTLILAGDREIVFPQNFLAAKCAFIPNHQYNVVPNSSSFLMIDQPEITATLVTEFFKAEIEHERYRDDTSTSIYNAMRQYTQNYYSNNNMPVKQSDNRNQIRVDLLNSFRVIINGTPVIKGLNQRYAKNMLVYLLFHPTTTREEMCDHIWPHEPLNISKKNLRVYLSHLKKILNSYSSSADHPILLVDREHIHINADIVCDALTMINELHQVNDIEDEEQKYIRAKQIMSELNSANYLTAIYDQWFIDMRESIENKLIDLVIWIGEWLIQIGKVAEGIQYMVDALPLFEGNQKIDDLIIKLYRKITNEDDHIQFSSHK